MIESNKLFKSVTKSPCSSVIPNLKAGDLHELDFTILILVVF